MLQWRLIIEESWNVINNIFSLNCIVLLQYDYFFNFYDVWNVTRLCKKFTLSSTTKQQVISPDLFAEVVMPLPGGGGSGDFTLYCACTFCGKMMRRSSLKRHIEDRHLPSRAVGCQYCSKVFRSNNSLQNHLSIYHRNAERNRKLNKSPNETKLNVTNPSSTWIEVGVTDEWISIWTYTLLICAIMDTIPGTMKMSVLWSVIRLRPRLEWALCDHREHFI